MGDQNFHSIFTIYSPACKTIYFDFFPNLKWWTRNIISSWTLSPSLLPSQCIFVERHCSSSKDGDVVGPSNLIIAWSVEREPLAAGGQLGSPMECAARAGRAVPAESKGVNGQCITVCDITELCEYTPMSRPLWGPLWEQLYKTSRLTPDAQPKQETPSRRLQATVDTLVKLEPAPCGNEHSVSAPQ